MRNKALKAWFLVGVIALVVAVFPKIGGAQDSVAYAPDELVKSMIEQLGSAGPASWASIGSRLDLTEKVDKSVNDTGDENLILLAERYTGNRAGNPERLRYAIGSDTSIASLIYGVSYGYYYSIVGLPRFGFIYYNRAGRISKIAGFNLALGYSERRFFGDGLQPERFNGYWGFGTVLLIIPYIELGVAYPIPISEGAQYIVINAGVIYIVPQVGVSVYF
jgi:hypothetical protein